MILFLLNRQKHLFWLYKLIFRLFEKTKKTIPDFCDEESKTCLGFEFGPPQRKCQRRPTLQSMANLAVEEKDAPFCSGIV